MVCEELIYFCSYFDCFLTECCNYLKNSNYLNKNPLFVHKVAFCSIKKAIALSIFDLHGREVQNILTLLPQKEMFPETCGLSPADPTLIQY